MEITRIVLAGAGTAVVVAGFGAVFALGAVSVCRLLKWPQLTTTVNFIGGQRDDD